ncbi:MAG: alpha/beta hydrolase [Alphaproteobacteria bacterium]
MTYRDGFVSAQDGKRLYYRDYGPPHGAATTVLCLPGLARNSSDFDALASRLAADRRVVCPDYRGRGRSDYDRDWRHYAPPSVAYDIATMLTALGIERAVAVGTSLGGLLAMGLAVSRPTVLRGAVLNDVGPDLPAGGLRRVRDYIARDRPLPDWPAAVATLQRMMPTVSVPEPAEDGWLTLAKGTWRESEDGLLRYDFDARLAKTLDRDGAAPDLWPLFRALARVPLVAVRGAVSDILTAETFARMAETAADLTPVTVDGVGHTPNLQEPECREAIDALLDRIG